MLIKSNKVFEFNKSIFLALFMFIECCLYSVMITKILNFNEVIFSNANLFIKHCLNSNALIFVRFSSENMTISKFVKFEIVIKFRNICKLLFENFRSE